MSSGRPTAALNIGRVDRRIGHRFAIKFRLETRGEIAARPTYLPPNPEVPGDSGMIYAASRDGFVHAIQENTGESFWQFSAGEPLLQPAVVIEEDVYVATQPGGMYCLDAKTGSEKWWAPQIKQFIAASKERIYVADKIDRILVLHGKTGARLDTLPAPDLPIKLINSDTDRLYLATESGLIQCLHELEHPEPLRHGEARWKAAAGGEPAPEQPGIEAGCPGRMKPPRKVPSARRTHSTYPQFPRAARARLTPAAPIRPTRTRSRVPPTTRLTDALDCGGGRIPARHDRRARWPTLMNDAG